MSKTKPPFKDKHVQLIIEALQIRICIIETGNPGMNAVAADAFNKSLTKTSTVSRIPIKPLSRLQRDAINDMEDIIEELI